MLLVLPIIIPLFTAALSFLLWRRPRVQRTLNVAGSILTLIAACALFIDVRSGGVQAAQMGGWAAPFGITIVADLFSAVMVLLACAMNLAAIVYSLYSIDDRREAYGYFPLLQILLMGVCGAFLTGDIFNLYVWFEVMLMSSFVLLALGGERAQIEASIKYVTINLLSSAIFLAAVGLLYGIAGTLNMADLAIKLRDAPTGMVTTLSILFLIAFGVKASLFPLYFWLPASYHTPPAAVSAIFAGLLTKVGVYSLVRVFTLIFTDNIAYTTNIILTLAGFTMLAGALGAIVQRDVRRTISFLIIAHIGVAVMGLGLYTTRAFAGMIFYLIEDIIVLTNLFLIVGVMGRLCGTYQLKQMGGLYRAYPVLAALFFIPALSLSGIPPFSGFFAKLALVQAGLEVGQFAIIAISLAVGILTLIAMMRIWAEAFWKSAPASELNEIKLEGNQNVKIPFVTRLLTPIGALSLCTIALGLGAEYVFTISLEAATQLTDSSIYIRAVFEVMR